MASPTVAPTAWVSTIFTDIFGKLDWNDLANSIKQKSIGGYITTAEHVGEVIVAGIAKTGNPIAMEAEMLIPTAEAILGAVINAIPALHSAGGAQSANPANAVSAKS